MRSAPSTPPPPPPPPFPVLRRALATLTLAAMVPLAGAQRPTPHGPHAPLATHASLASPTTHEVRMLGPANNPRFEPNEVQIASGDSVAFVVVSGEPHNVAFDTTALDPEVRDKLRAAIHDAMLPMAGPLLLKAGDRYAISFAGIPAGRYTFYCMPHMALHMQGAVVVR